MTGKCGLTERLPPPQVWDGDQHSPPPQPPENTLHPLPSPLPVLPSLAGDPRGLFTSAGLSLSFLLPAAHSGQLRVSLDAALLWPPRRPPASEPSPIPLAGQQPHPSCWGSPVAPRCPSSLHSSLRAGQLLTPVLGTAAALEWAPPASRPLPSLLPHAPSQWHAFPGLWITLVNEDSRILRPLCSSLLSSAAH